MTDEVNQTQTHQHIRRHADSRMHTHSLAHSHSLAQENKLLAAQFMGSKPPTRGARDQTLHHKEHRVTKTLRSAKSSRNVFHHNKAWLAYCFAGTQDSFALIFATTHEKKWPRANVHLGDFGVRMKCPKRTLTEEIHSLNVPRSWIFSMHIASKEKKRKE